MPQTPLHDDRVEDAAAPVCDSAMTDRHPQQQLFHVVPSDEPSEPAVTTPTEPTKRPLSRRLNETWQTVNGLLTITDMLAKLGFWLYRGTMRRTAGVAFALLTVVFVGKSDAIQAADLTLKQAISATGVILLISFIGGLAIMGVSGSFARSQLTAAEAKGSNMLEEMKKARAIEHRDSLWHRVFRYEQDLVGPEEQIEELKLIQSHQPKLNRLCHPNTKRDMSRAEVRELRAVIRQLGRTRAGWDIVFDYACQVPVARTVLKDRLRFDLTKVKDWYDGAPFHHTDTKLQEQFAAAENLQVAKRDVGLDWWFIFWHTRKRVLQTMWFKMITRAIQLRVARACQTLDRRYAPYHFAPDAFLWPSDDVYRVVRREAGDEALNDLIDLRKRIFQRVLNHEPELAITLMHRAIYPNFETASHLRRLFDPQYVLGELGEAWRSDLRKYDRAFRPREKDVQRRIEYTRTVATQQRAVEALMDDGTVPVGQDAEARRAVRIATHINRDGLRDLLESANLEAADTIDTIQQVGRAVIADRKLYTKRLRAVRTHHELTRIELEDYEFYVNRILH